MYIITRVSAFRKCVTHLKNFTLRYTKFNLCAALLLLSGTYEITDYFEFCRKNRIMRLTNQSSMYTFNNDIYIIDVRVCCTF